MNFQVPYFVCFTFFVNVILGVLQVTESIMWPWWCVLLPMMIAMGLWSAMQIFLWCLPKDVKIAMAIKDRSAKSIRFR